METLRPAFADSRVYERARRLAIGLLITHEPRTITALMEATGKTGCDWSADYRVFSRDAWEARDLFSLLVPHILALHPTDTGRVIAAIDDTTVRKTGKHIPGASYRRDPMSPPFHTNLIRAQRFLQTSITVPFAPGPSPARAIPVTFDHAPSAHKIGKDATPEQRRLHRELADQCSLASHANFAIKHLRDDLDRSSSQPQSLLLTVDGSYTNRKILTALPPNTHLVGRIRKDAQLHHPPANEPVRGRPRSYGDVITPEQLRQDDRTLWRTVKIFGSGRVHECDVKEAFPLLWRKTGPTLPLRLIVIRPLAYRRSRASRLLYRDPAYLITTDLSSPLDELVQAYFWRWDIEVNHRDEKQLIGVGDAQVRSEKSARRVPAFAVACYSMLLISAAKAFGIAATRPITERPKWLARSTKRQLRLSTSQLLQRLAEEWKDRPISLPNFDHFGTKVARSLKLPKCAVNLSQALQHALN